MVSCFIYYFDVLMLDLILFKSVALLPGFEIQEAPHSRKFKWLNAACRQGTALILSALAQLRS
jgi:hypothetical protein